MFEDIYVYDKFHLLYLSYWKNTIFKIAYNAINNKAIPNYLSRSNKSSGSLDELPKPKFTRSVKGKPF